MNFVDSTVGCNNEECKLLNLEKETIEEILKYCSAQSLCALSSSCKFFNTSIEKSMQYAWGALCKKGWRISERERLKISGKCSNMKHTYKVLWHRMRIPFGRYTERFNYIFGKGRSSTASCWVTIRHTNNTELYNSTVLIDGSKVTKHLVDVRFCVQNLADSPLFIDLSKPHHTMKVFCLNIDEDQDNFEVISINEVARNGSAVSNSLLESYSRCCLNPLEFVVLQCKVSSPAWIKYESDFLSIIGKIQLIAKYPSTDTKIENHIVLEAAMISEEEVWEYYIELPGGVVLLRDKPLYEVW